MHVVEMASDDEAEIREGNGTTSSFGFDLSAFLRTVRYTTGPTARP